MLEISSMITEEIVMQTLKCSKDQYPRMLLKQFPHVLEKIVAKWHSPDFSAFMADLLQTNGRSGGRLDRDGFPESVWQELYKLVELHKTARPR